MSDLRKSYKNKAGAGRPYRLTGFAKRSISGGGVVVDSFHQRHTYQMLAEEPYLQFVGAQYVADHEVVGTIVFERISPFRQITTVSDDYLVSIQQARDLHRNLFPSLGWPFDSSRLGHIGRHGDTQAAEQLDALGYGVDQFGLLAEMFVEK
jgi:hypothetical protein